MGSFRSADARARDMAVLTAADRPVEVDETDPFGRPTWLAEGESIAYLTRLPYSAACRIATEATRGASGPDGVVSVYDVGTAAIAKLRAGIIGWELTDENGSPVEWYLFLAASLIDGLPPEVVRVLGERIGRDAPLWVDPPVAVEGDVITD